VHYTKCIVFLIDLLRIHTYFIVYLFFEFLEISINNYFKTVVHKNRYV
jgi:hypothetical protein